jgi:hypothetical protein
MNKIRTWYLQHRQQITWFILGWLTLSFISSLANGDFVNASIAGGLILLNVVIK